MVEKRRRIDEDKKRRLLTAVVIIISVLIMGGIVTASVLVTVGVPAAELYFEKENLKIAVGDSVELPLAYSPRIAAVEIISYNEEFAKVENGRLIGVGTGGSPYATTVIEAKSGDKVARLMVTVFTSSEAGSDADYRIVLLEANDNYDGGYQNVLKILYKNHGTTLTENEVAVESDKAGYMFSGEWFFDAECTDKVDFASLSPVSSNMSLYTEPRLLRDGTTKQTKGGKWIDTSIDLLVRMEEGDDSRMVVFGLKYPELPYKSIQIPKTYYFNGATRTVEGIDYRAFDATKNFDNEKDMGNYAKLADSLETVIMPSTIKVIGNLAFNGLTKLSAVETKLPAGALYRTDPNDPRAGTSAAETADARFEWVGKDVFKGTKWLDNQIRKTGIRVVGGEDGGQGETLNYYSGAVLSNCLVAVDDEVLAQYGYKLHYFPVSHPNTGLSVDVVASGVTFENHTVEFAVDESEVEDYRSMVAACGLSSKITVVAY